jgi:hypothetical protein
MHYVHYRRTTGEECGNDRWARQTDIRSGLNRTLGTSHHVTVSTRKNVVVAWQPAERGSSNLWHTMTPKGECLHERTRRCHPLQLKPVPEPNGPHLSNNIGSQSPPQTTRGAFPGTQVRPRAMGHTRPETEPLTTTCSVMSARCPPVGEYGAPKVCCPSFPRFPKLRSWSRYPLQTSPHGVCELACLTDFCSALPPPWSVGSAHIAPARGCPVLTQGSLVAWGFFASRALFSVRVVQLRSSSWIDTNG